ADLQRNVARMGGSRKQHRGGSDQTDGELARCHATSPDGCTNCIGAGTAMFPRTPGTLPVDGRRSGLQSAIRIERGGTPAGIVPNGVSHEIQGFGRIDVHACVSAGQERTLPDSELSAFGQSAVRSITGSGPPAT